MARAEWRVMRWQPIETAPQDELVLAWLPLIKAVRMAKYHSSRRGRGLPPSWRYIEWSATPMRPSQHGGNQPTHWMPLPPPPSPSDVEGG